MDILLELETLASECDALDVAMMVNEQREWLEAELEAERQRLKAHKSKSSAQPRPVGRQVPDGASQPAAGGSDASSSGAAPSGAATA